MFTRAPHTPSRRSISTRVLLLEEVDLKEAKTSSNNSDTTSDAASFERLVVRDLPFHQSSNSVRVRHQSSQSIIHKHKKILPLPFHWYEDWFHVLLRLRTVVSVLLFVTIWTLFILMFAAIYVYIDKQDPYEDCGLGKVPHPIGFYGAFAFSLETTTTVG